MKHGRPAAFLALMLSFFTLTNCYILYRLCSWLRLELFSPPFWLCLAVYAAMLCLLLRSFGKIRSDARPVFKLIGAYGMGFYLSFSLALALTCFLPAKSPVSGWLALGLALAYALCGFYHARQLRLRHYHIPLLDEPFTLVLLSDVHLGAVGSEERLQKQVDSINALQPDLVCIAGDLFDNCFHAIRSPARAAEALRQIKSRCGVYACLGNHDAGETVEDMLRLAREGNITVLREEYAVIDRRLLLLGRLDAHPHGGYGGISRGSSEELLKKAEESPLPLVVLDHNPDVIDQYEGSRARLVLCGHTHKGQLFPGSLVIRAVYTCGYGHYQKDAASPHVIVTSGAGTWGMPMRVGTDCEIVSIQLGGAAPEA